MELTKSSKNCISFEDIKNSKFYKKIIDSDLTLFECSHSIAENKYQIKFSDENEKLEFVKVGLIYYFTGLTNE